MIALSHGIDGLVQERRSSIPDALELTPRIALSENRVLSWFQFNKDIQHRCVSNRFDIPHQTFTEYAVSCVTR